MDLSTDLISQFVKATKDNTKTSNEDTVNGTVMEYGDKIYVKLDGSDLLTPVRTTADVQVGERVTVSIKDHTATLTGNVSSPAARTDTVKEVAATVYEYELLSAHKVTAEELEAVNATIQNLKAELISTNKLEAVSATIENLEAKFANVEYLTATEIKAVTATIENLKATVGTFTDLSTDKLTALNATIDNLKGHTADFTHVSTDYLEAIKANVKELDAKKLSADQAEINYANINFANIGEAAIKKLFADAGIIKELTTSKNYITGELIGVTIKGDAIIANTLQADKLIIKGEDGLYYKLNVDALGATSTEIAKDVLENGLHGSVIIANSVTAEKIRVDDLVAFDATIGGFNITENSLYSGVKESATNTTRGIYLDREGQIALGDSNDYLKYYKDADNKYKLEIAASSMVMSSSGKTVEDTIQETIKGELGSRNLIRNSTNLLYEDYGFEASDLNTVESTIVSDPDGNESECALLSLTATGPFVFRNILTVGETYTFTCWMKSDNVSLAVLEDLSMSITNTWKKFSTTFKATSTDLTIQFYFNGNHYIFHPKLELGTVATDWTPAPEDQDTSVDMSEINDSIHTINESVGKLIIEKDGILSTVENIETIVNESSNDILSLKTHASKIEQDSKSLEIKFNDFVTDGINSVTTETGYTFDREGLTVDSSDSQTKTQITPDGMTVYQKDADGTSDEVLEATSEGVNAKNLHASTYLIIGGRSRFENFGTNRTGCFWIGG